MFVGQRRKRNRAESSAFEPMNSRCINRNRFFSCNVGTVLQVIMLSFLLRFQIQSSQSPQILLTNSFVHSRAASDSLSVIMRRVCPPISFRLDVSQNHVFNRGRQSRYLPRYVRFPASPSFAQVLQNHSRFILFDAFRHHVKDVMHNSRAQLQIVVTLNSLFGDSFRDSFRVSTFELSR